jgi:PmbA protein
MEPPEQVGIEAAHRTLRRLGARKIKTCEVPIVLEPLAAAAVLKNISEAVSGTSIVRKASFLISKLGARVASRLVTIRDDALLDGGPGSRPFDAEGIPSQSTVIVREGVLESYLLDSYSGRKLGFRSTGNSNREPNGSPSVGPANFFLEGGSISPGEIIASVKRGLVVTELIGFGADIVSGNYSQGASGIWIENGQPAFPVEEVTIAGNLMDMMLGIEAVGDDLLALGEVFAPTVLIGKMIVSGS